MTILLVDDSRLTIKLLETMFQKHKLGCISVEHGAEALVCLDGFPEIQLIISDIEMPDMSGLELLETIGKHPEWELIPFMFHSEKATPEYVQRAKSLGCAGFLIKPISENDLVTKVKIILQDQPNILKEPSVVMNMFGFDQNTYIEFAVAFQEELQTVIKLIEDKAGAEDPKHVVRAISRLRDGAKIIGAQRLLTAFDRYDKAVREGHKYTRERDNPIFLREFQAILKVFSEGKDFAFF